MDNLWYKTAEPAPKTKQIDAVRSVYELVVVGAGFTGCSAALTASEMGASVAVFERKTIGYGGSGRNVGLVNAGLWTLPETIENALGADRGRHLYDSLSAAPDRVYSLIDRLNIECEGHRGGTLHCAHSDRGFQELRARYKQLRARGASVELLDKHAAGHRIGSDQFHGALFDPRAGTIQPLSYVRGLARVAIKQGADFFEHCGVEAIKKTSSGWMVTVNGRTIFAKALLVATNAYAENMSGMPRPEFAKVHYFQASTRPLSKTLRRTILADREGCWDTAQVMSSFRLDRAGRLIIGGIGSLEDIGRGAHRAWARRKMVKLFPQLADEPLHEFWSGAICMTSDKLPKIVEIGRKGYAIYGYSGRGIGPGTMFGYTAACALLQGHISDLPLEPIAEHREKLPLVRSVFYEMGATLTHLMAVRSQ